MNLTNAVPEPDVENEMLDQRVDAVVAELQSAGTNAESSSRKIVLLIGSAFLFIVLGAWFWSVEIVLYLLPILLFHELGHYIAMRYFKYRNVKMFFLPLLGAAVSGQHFNVAGWKKVIVSLAGPLPGILLAIPMAVIAIKTQSDLWRNATVMIVLINAFNLLPLLPLDGGWVAHALYFCRQPWLDVLFRLTAAIAMISVGVTWQLFFFTAFGALMLLAVPAAIRNSKIAQAVKVNDLEEVSDDTVEIPRSTVEKIVAQLPTSGPASLPKPLTQQTRQIFDVLNSRPPGIMATIGLTLLYLAGWILSFGVLAALFLWPQWQQAWSVAPVVKVADDAEVLVYCPDQQPVDDHINRYLVLGVCDDANAVEMCVAVLQKHDDCRFAFATAGNAILLSVDTDEAESEAGTAMIKGFKSMVKSHHWFETSDVFHFQLKCVATDADQAETLVNRANEMLIFGNDLALIEPWSPDHSLSEAQLNRRETRRILDAPFDAATDEALVELSDMLNESNSTSRDEVRQQMDRYDQLYEQRYEVAFNEMKQGDSGKHDQGLLELWERRPGRFHNAEANERANTMDENQWRSKLADLLGRIPGTTPVGIKQDEDRIPDLPSVKPFKYAVTAGVVFNEESQIQFSFLHFRNPITGFPALLKWLQSNGCHDLQFQISENLDLSSLP